MKDYILNILFPTRMRRLVLISSLLGRITDKKKLDDSTLQRVNEVLCICSKSSAMKLPIEYSHTLWNDELVHSLDELVDSTTKIQEVKYKALQKVPSWLRYNRVQMERDVEDLLLILPKVVH